MNTVEQAFSLTVHAAAVVTPVPLFGARWEKALLSLMLVGMAALGARMRDRA